MTSFHMKRKRSLRTYVPCPVCGWKISLRGTEIPRHRDDRFDSPIMNCPASGQGMLEVVDGLCREPA